VAKPGANTGPRWLAFTLGVIGAVTLVIALLTEPLGEWTGNARFLGGVLFVVTLLWFFVGVRGRFNLMGRYRPRTAMIISAIGVLAAGVVIGSTIFGDVYGTVSDIIMTGLWLAIAVMFAVTFVVASNVKKATESTD
jgi:hypothetical protein